MKYKFQVMVEVDLGHYSLDAEGRSKLQDCMEAGRAPVPSSSNPLQAHKQFSGLLLGLLRHNEFPVREVAVRVEPVDE